MQLHNIDTHVIDPISGEASLVRPGKEMTIRLLILTALWSDKQGQQSPDAERALDIYKLAGRIKDYVDGPGNSPLEVSVDDVTLIKDRAKHGTLSTFAYGFLDSYFEKAANGTNPDRSADGDT